MKKLRSWFFLGSLLVAAGCQSYAPAPRPQMSQDEYEQAFISCYRCFGPAAIECSGPSVYRWGGRCPHL